MAAAPGRWDASGEIVAEGPLWKRSDRLRLWRERYCVLRNSGPGPVLDYWRTALERWSDNPVRGSLILGGSAGTRPETSQVDDLRQDDNTDPAAQRATGSCATVWRSEDDSRTFAVLARPGLSGPPKSYFLRAPTERHALRWVAALEAAVSGTKAGPLCGPVTENAALPAARAEARQSTATADGMPRPSVGPGKGAARVLGCRPAPAPLAGAISRALLACIGRSYDTALCRATFWRWRAAALASGREQAVALAAAAAAADDAMESGGGEDGAGPEMTWPVDTSFRCGGGGGRGGGGGDDASQRVDLRVVFPKVALGRIGLPPATSPGSARARSGRSQSRRASGRASSDGSDAGSPPQYGSVGAWGGAFYGDSPSTVATEATGTEVGVFV